jgi:glc operon protein GlcG
MNRPQEEQMKKLFTFAVAALLGVTFGATAQAQTVQKKGLTLEGAKKMIAAAVAEAKSKNAPGGAIAVVDDGGNLVAVERLDNTFAAGANISIGKARTAALFKRPTKFFEDVINKGRIAMATLSDFTPLQGGVPIIVDGQVIGAIGVSGAASAQQDEELAIAGAAAFAEPMKAQANSSVAYLAAEKVKKAFEKGMPLLEVANYKVHASHRDAPGVVEVHTRDTDILYMLEGSATLVTGGTVIDSKTVEPEEIRGRDVRGGETRRITRGDVIVIPNGTPHWFKEVSGPIHYYVVKVRSVN